MNDWELAELEVGERATRAMADELLDKARRESKEKRRLKELALRVAPKGANVERAEIRRRRERNKRAKRARKRGRRG